MHAVPWRNIHKRFQPFYTPTTIALSISLSRSDQLLTLGEKPRHKRRQEDRSRRLSVLPRTPHAGPVSAVHLLNIAKHSGRPTQ